MRNFVLVALSLLVSVSAAMAQSKVETKWHCQKPAADHKFDVGDVPDHSYWIGQGTCNATSSGSAFSFTRWSPRLSSACTAQTHG